MNYNLDEIIWKQYPNGFQIIFKERDGPEAQRGKLNWKLNATL